MISVLNERQLKRLAEHKYSAQCVSILDPCFQVYWRWLVEQLPLWLAPNTITISGLVINVVTSLLLIWYCPQAKGEVSFAFEIAFREAVMSWDVFNKMFVVLLVNNECFVFALFLAFWRNSIQSSYCLFLLETTTCLVFQNLLSFATILISHFCKLYCT